MKWPTKQVEILRSAFLQVLDGSGYSVQDVKRLDNPEACLRDVFRVAVYDLQYDDSHPAYVNGRKRLVPFNPDFVLYPPGCNDSHLKTVLKRIGKDIGVL